MNTLSLSHITDRSGLSVSRNLSTKNSCLPVMESVRAPRMFQIVLWIPRSGVRTPR
jgi:hypothetical protein